MKEEKFLCDEEILKWLTEKNLSGIIKGIDQNKGIINEKIGGNYNEKRHIVTVDDFAAINNVAYRSICSMGRNSYY